MGAGPLDYLIIGAGPAGLQLAQELGAAGHDYLVLESAKVPGTFFTRFPRHRQLISINKPHTGTEDPELNLRMDWNSLLSPDEDLLFTRYSERYFPAADDLLRYLADYASKTRPCASTTRPRATARQQRRRRPVRGGGLPRPRSPGPPSHRGDRSRQAPISAPIPGIELAEQYADVPVDPARVHRSAGADHRKGQLGPGDRRQPQSRRRRSSTSPGRGRCNSPGGPTTWGTCAR